MKRKSSKTSKRKPAGRTRALAVDAGSPLVAIKFNINEYFRVKLTERGKQLHRDQHAALNARFPAALLKYTAPEEDGEGWSKWQAWHLMQTFGEHIGMGFDPPFETTIEILANEKAS